MGFTHLFQLLMLWQVLNLASCVDVDCSSGTTYQKICKNRSQKPASLFHSKPSDALDSLCSTSSEMVECLKAHVDQCPTLAPPGFDGALDTDPAAIEKAETDSKQFCEDEVFRSNFVTHARCLKATLYCNIHAKTAIQQLEQLQLVAGTDPAAAEDVNKICGALSKYDNCVSFVVKTMCPEDSREFVKGYATQAVPPVKSVLCEKNDK